MKLKKKPRNGITCNLRSASSVSRTVLMKRPVVCLASINFIHTLKSARLRDSHKWLTRNVAEHL